jgi:pimeloyl-ACP methyl ester carboxylesterase
LKAALEQHRTINNCPKMLIHQPTLVIHIREDNSVPFSHAEWSVIHIPQAEVCEAGITGHFFWVGPDYPRICQQLVAFLKRE